MIQIDTSVNGLSPDDKSFLWYLGRWSERECVNVNEKVSQALLKKRVTNDYEKVSQDTHE